MGKKIVNISPIHFQARSAHFFTISYLNHGEKTLCLDYFALFTTSLGVALFRHDLCIIHEKHEIWSLISSSACRVTCLIADNKGLIT